MVVQLTQGRVALIDDEDWPKIKPYRWYAQWNNRNTWYAMITNKGNLRMHRLIMGAQPGQEVDHINGNGLDNRKANLRLCTRSQNAASSGPQQGRKYKGTIRRASGKYKAQIYINSKQHYLGTFDTEEQAAEAYNQAAIELFGEFAILNHISGDST